MEATTQYHKNSTRGEAPMAFVEIDYFETVDASGHVVSRRLPAGYRAECRGNTVRLIAESAL